MRQVDVNELYLLLIDLDVEVAERVIEKFGFKDPKLLYTDLFTLPHVELNRLNTLVRCYQQEDLLRSSKTTYNDVYNCCIVNTHSLTGLYTTPLDSFDKRLMFYDTVSQINSKLFEGFSVKNVIDSTPDDFKAVVPVLVSLYNSHDAILVYPAIEKTQGCLSYYSIENNLIGVYFE